MKIKSLLLAATCSLIAAGCGEDGGSSGDDTDSGVQADDDADDDDADDDVPDDDVPDDDAPDDDVPDDDDADDDDVPVDAGGGPDDAGLPDPHAIPEDASVGVRQCAELGSVCHAFDRGTGDLGDQCHDIGHEGNVDECVAMYDECIAFCSVDGGVDHDDHDAGEHHDGGHSMCEELGSICHDLDTGADAGLAHECHEVGHGGEEAACGEIYDECVDLCGEHHEEEADAGPSMCEELGSVCHDADTGDAGLAGECHEVGHGGDEEACGAIYDECIEVCEHHEADAGE